jgi:hypothetical protein
MGSSEAAHTSAQVGSSILRAFRDSQSSRKHHLAGQRKAMECQALHPTQISDDVIDAATSRSLTSTNSSHITFDQ